MPAVYKRPDSKNYWAAWGDEAGKLYRKSTKCTNRSQEEKAAAAMTVAFRRRKVSAHVREVCLNFHREATGEAMPETSLRAYADTWLATKKNEVSTATKKAATARRAAGRSRSRKFTRSYRPATTNGGGW